MRFLSLALPLLPLALGLSRSEASYTFQTLAGADIGPGYVDGTGSAARFSSPNGIVADASGNVYVADFANNAIRMITPGGVVTTIAGSPTGAAGYQDGVGSAALFNGPSALAIDGQGRLYVADTTDGYVRMIVVAGGVGTVTTVMGSAGTITGVAVDAAGANLYFTCGSLNSIHSVSLNNGVGSDNLLLVGDEFDPGGFADGVGPAVQFNGPTALVLAAPNLLYVADTGNSLIRAVTISGGVGTVTTVAGYGGSGNIDGTGWTGETPGTASFSSPSGLALDATGNLWVADSQDDTIRTISFPGGGAPAQVTTAYGVGQAALSLDGSAATARFNDPTSLAFDGQGNLYVTDNKTNLIRKISGGSVTTLAGETGDAWADGSGAAARFASPEGMAVDGMGNSYVADAVNQVIRKITPLGVVTTVAGSPGVPGNQDGPGASALFNNPMGVAVDSAGDTLYVADEGNAALRKITISGGTATVSTLVHNSTYVIFGVACDASGDVFFTELYSQAIIEYSQGTVTTIAGGSYESGFSDGVGELGFFYDPIGIAASADGKTLYVADQGNYHIRKITVANGVGTVTTVPVYAGPVWGVALDAQGNIYFTLPFAGVIEEVSAGGAFSTVGGSGVEGELDGVGTAAEFHDPLGIAVDANQNLYVGDYEGYTIREGLSGNAGLSQAPVITTQPLSQDATAGAEVTLTVVATGTPTPTYQWAFNDAPIAGATSASLSLTSVTPADSGVYAVTVSNSQGSVTSGPAVLTVGTVPQIITPPEGQTAMVGGSAQFGVQVTGLPSVSYQWSFDGQAIAGATGNTLDLTNLTTGEAGTYGLTASNFAGSATASAQLAVELPPAPVILSSPVLVGTVGQSLSFALQASNDPVSFSEAGALPPGAQFVSATGAIAGTPTGPGVYPVKITATNAGGSATLDLVVTVNPASYPVNFSVLAAAGGADTLTVGFIVSGSGTEQTLMRAVGPTLAVFGVQDSLPDPVLSLYDSHPTLIASNAAWGGGAALAAAFAATGAFALPSSSKDDALLQTLTPGGYTCQATSSSGDSGVALVELYEDNSGPPTSHLANLSGLARVGALGAPLSAGFVIAGSQPKKLLLRAVGPTLGAFGLSGVLAQPKLTLVDQSGLVVATNTGWGLAPVAGPSPVVAQPAAATPAEMAGVGAFPLLAGSDDGAMVVTLPPGSYSAQVSAPNGGAGWALFEYYEL